MTKHLITSALPYINGVKHIGNLIGSMLPADVYARFLRQRGEEVLYICATDDHGTPAELGALKQDEHTLELAKRIYERMGYGNADGELFLLEAGLEEAVKKNLKQLGLRLADENIRQQCALGIGIGRTDLVCLDKKDNFVVLELKAVNSSEAVIGQIQKYMGYIRENWAKKLGKEVSGIILAPNFDEGLRYAAQEAKIKVLRIRIA